MLRRHARFVLRLLSAAALPAACDLSPVPSPSFAVLPAVATAQIGERLQLRAVWRNADGTPAMPPAGGPSWGTNRPDLVTVDDSGLTLGIAGGTAIVTATSAGVQASARITVVTAAAQVLVGAGDIAACASGADESTATLLDAIPGTVFTAGDNVYATGSVQADFTGCYEPSWGRHKARTRPAIGHMEYSAVGSSNYWLYFSAAAGDSGKGYYSYDLGAWHVVVLNSKLSMESGSAQDQWLRADLDASPKTCTLAIWHLPLYSSTGVAFRAEAQGVWRTLYEAGAEVVVNAHYEVYERFAPQTPDGVIDAATGIRQFTIGTGGIGRNTFTAFLPNSEAASSGTFGVLKLTLGPGSYAWQFVHVPGKTFTDAGSTACHGRPGTALPVASVTVAPATATVAVGRSVQLTATARDAAGNPVGGHAVTWSTSDTAVARVTLAGKVVGWAAGEAVIRATIDGYSDSADIEVEPASFVILVGAGDIASCDQQGDEATAALLDFIPGTVFTLGDNAYETGSAADYAACYAPSWGRHKARTKPTPGNHEYETPGAAGYFGYYGAVAGDTGKGYYTYTAGAWRVIVLNSEIAKDAGSTQVRWLDSTLVASTEPCTLAMWHEPRFSSGSVHGTDPSTAVLWNTLYRRGADVVLVGHEHSYERFAPQDTAGLPDNTNGIREFVVGTGGASLYDFRTPLPTSEVRDNGSWGVLKLELSAGSYAWAFVPAQGGTFTDAGSGGCH